MTRSLSAVEAKLILKLEWDKKSLVTIPQAMAALGASYDHTRQVLHRLARDGWLARLGAGKYELIPAERGEFAFADPNPLLAGSALVTPYYFSYSTAAYHHGLTTQAPAVVYIATISGKTQRRVIRDHEYQLIYQPKQHFFGAVEVES
ncbi:MAG: type IV toxin-antitoxin system AbiEi family antitoxin domain-containing protein, partial [Anaerolineales bacterium]|nr:type IV toxin-antitoxin system AbiEi family antitoxin domain-containing protein [Anaerolineales bacterium]